MHFLLDLPLNPPFKAIGGHFDQESLKSYMCRASKINTSNYANGSTNLISLRENKFIGIAFEDFKKSLKELEQKNGCG